jgi:hypothetical protein
MHVGVGVHADHDSTWRGVVLEGARHSLLLGNCDVTDQAVDST